MNKACEFFFSLSTFVWFIDLKFGIQNTHNVITYKSLIRVYNINCQKSK